MEHQNLAKNWPYLVILFLIHLGGQWQQYFLVYVNDGDAYTSFSVALDLSLAQYALVTGTAVSMTNAISGLAMGYLVDSTNRKYLLLVCGLLWNFFCMLTYWVETFEQLLAIRILFAVI